MARGTQTKIAAAIDTASTKLGRLVACGRGTWLQYDLLLIGCPHCLKEKSQCRVVLLLQDQKINFQLASEMQHVLAVLRFQAVSNKTFVLILGGRNTSNLPARRQFNGDVIDFFVRILEINSVDAVRKLKDELVGRGKHSGRNQETLSRIRCPARNSDVESAYQRVFRTLPIRLI